MQKKTAMQQLIEWLGELKKCDPALSPTITIMENKATELLPAEKLDIKDAVWYGRTYHDDICSGTDTEQYYSQTFNQ